MTTPEKTPLEIASINVAGTVAKLGLNDTIAKEIIAAFDSPEFAENKEFPYSDIIKTISSRGYFEATKKQIWSLANHEMTAKEVQILDEIVATYAYSKQFTDSPHGNRVSADAIGKADNQENNY